MLEFFGKYIFSSFSDKGNISDHVNTAFMCLFGLYITVMVLYVMSIFIKQKETDDNRHALSCFLLPGMCLLFGTIFSLYLTPFLFLLFAIICYKNLPSDEGLYQFTKKHGFEYAIRYEFFYEMGKYFPKGYRYKDLEHYIDWKYIAKVRKKIIKSFVYHFIVWTFCMTVLFVIKGY